MSPCPRSGVVTEETLNARRDREYIRTWMKEFRCACGAALPIAPTADAVGRCFVTVPSHEQAGPIFDPMAEQRAAWERQGFGPNGPPAHSSGPRLRIGIPMPTDWRES
jgi:hypothetical protein